LLVQNLEGFHVVRHLLLQGTQRLFERLLLHTQHAAEQLLLQTLEGDGEVNYRTLLGKFGGEVGVRKTGGHEEIKFIVVVHVLVTDVDHFVPTLLHNLLVQEGV